MRSVAAISWKFSTHNSASLHMEEAVGADDRRGEDIVNFSADVGRMIDSEDVRFMSANYWRIASRPRTP